MVIGRRMHVSKEQVIFDIQQSAGGSWRSHTRRSFIDIVAKAYETVNC